MNFYDLVIVLRKLNEGQNATRFTFYLEGSGVVKNDYPLSVFFDNNTKRWVFIGLKTTTKATIAEIAELIVNFYAPTSLTIQTTINQTVK